MSEEYVIDVQGLVKRFANKIAVNSVDLQLKKGEVWGFLGPNGSGKTTTIRMICGLLHADEGHGTCLGLDIQKDAEQIRRQTGYMTQRFSFWSDLSIRENLEFVARLYQIKNKRQVIDDTLKKLGLFDRQKQLAGALSGGWKQRLALAAVTMHKPKLLLLDEPTAGVDPQARRDFWDEIHRLSLDGMTVLVSTHYMDEAERCDQIAYLAYGELITKGSVQQIIDQSELVTIKGVGSQVRALLSEIKNNTNIEQASYFGSALHVSGHDMTLIKQGIEQAQTKLNIHDIQWQEVSPTLEDVFIALTQRTGGDKRGHG
ncbi:ABC transporter ATP-binding protein [Marinicellulosiphila megalodicopiae]|uniref:ABC transporter ATP-binding protein n=1 Tax=Marinicellulosiphila megalodicopiae TaxID=2724896 RepID=UPI003BB19A55